MQMPITMYKVILIGPSQVGKTSIVSSFVSDICLDQYRPTIGIDFSVKMITFDGNVAKLQIWDSAGKQSYKTNITHFLSSTQIFMFVFDLTSQDSFCQVKKEILKAYEQLKESNQHCTAVLVGNKLDKVEERQVGYEQANQYGKHVGRYIEVSAMSKTNLEELFIQAARDKFSFDTQTEPSVKNFSQRMRQFTGQNLIQQLKQIGQLSLEQKTEKPALDPYNLLLKKHSQTEPVAPKVSSLNLKYNIKKVNDFQDETINPIVIKVAIVGEEAVGKTNIINVYAKSQFNEKHLNTFGVDYTFTKIKIDDKYYVLQLCDTAGREAYKTVTSVLYKNLKIALVVYDKTNIASFDAVRKHINELKQISPDVYVCIVGNKKDQQAVVSTEHGMKLAEELKTDFIEVSARKTQNIDDIFSKALNHALQNKLI